MGKAALRVPANLKAKLAAAQPQHRFQLRVTLQAFGHVGHVLRSRSGTPEIAVANKLVMLPLKLLPTFDKPVRSGVGIDADFRLQLHRADSRLTSPFCGVPDKFRAMPECAIEIRCALGADRVQRLPSLLQRHLLVRHGFQPLRPRLLDLMRRPCIAFHGTAKTTEPDRLRITAMVMLDCWLGLRRRCLGPEMVEESTRFLRACARNLRHPFPKADAPPLGKGPSDLG